MTSETSSGDRSPERPVRVTVQAKTNPQGVILIGKSLDAFSTHHDVIGGKPADITLPKGSVLALAGSEGTQCFPIDSMQVQVTGAILRVLAASHEGKSVPLPQGWAKSPDKPPVTPEKKAKPYEPMVQVSPAIEQELRALLLAHEAHLERKRVEKQQAAAGGAEAKLEKRDPLWTTALRSVIARIEEEYRKRHPPSGEGVPAARSGFRARIGAALSVFRGAKFDQPIDPQHPTITASILMEVIVNGTAVGEIAPAQLRERIHVFVDTLATKGAAIGEDVYAQESTRQTRQFARHVIDRYEFAGVMAGDQTGVSDKKRSLQLGMAKLKESDSRVVQQAGFRMILDTIGKEAMRPPVATGVGREEKVAEHDARIGKAIELVVDSKYFRELSPTKKRETVARLQEVRERVEGRGHVKIPPGVLSGAKSAKSTVV